MALAEVMRAEVAVARYLAGKVAARAVAVVRAGVARVAVKAEVEAVCRLAGRAAARVVTAQAVAQVVVRAVVAAVRHLAGRAVSSTTYEPPSGGSRRAKTRAVGSTAW